MAGDWNHGVRLGSQRRENRPLKARGQIMSTPDFLNSFIHRGVSPCGDSDPLLEGAPPPPIFLGRALLRSGSTYLSQNRDLGAYLLRRCLSSWYVRVPERKKQTNKTILGRSLEVVGSNLGPLKWW